MTVLRLSLFSWFFLNGMALVSTTVYSADQVDGKGVICGAIICALQGCDVYESRETGYFFYQGNVLGRSFSQKEGKTQTYLHQKSIIAYKTTNKLISWGEVIKRKLNRKTLELQYTDGNEVFSTSSCRVFENQTEYLNEWSLLQLRYQSKQP